MFLIFLLNYAINLSSKNFVWVSVCSFTTSWIFFLIQDYSFSWLNIVLEIMNFPLAEQNIENEFIKSGKIYLRFKAC
ncbi:hypothetical protein EUTSA_v10027597mg [Eutrema salsugineum]|uniref:Uncharacterized protein n=1 Tax=Eutrema salsugineum TaxID=72664 RepID=V4MLI9_EUTSA|nr:hypothetical protein EUTSA_v10027597mg [Eutrema salsugineum]